MILRQYNLLHPGVLIRRTYIELFKDITAASIARELGVSKSTFSRLLAGKSDISPEMAVRLSVVLGRSAESWLLMQDNYGLWKARQSIDVSSLERIDLIKWRESNKGKKLAGYHDIRCRQYNQLLDYIGEL